jgi:type IV pilus assembly protein PilP
MHNYRIKLKLNTALILLLSIFSSVFLSGCTGSSSRSEIEQFVVKTKATHKHKVEPLPPKIVKPDARYIGVTKRSPFVSSDEFIKSQVASSNAVDVPDLDRVKEVLEKINLEDLTMVGSLKKDDNTTWGLIADNTGRIYKVKEGQYIGQNFGKIIHVNEKNIEIKEAVSNGFGGWQSNTVVMKLKE